VRTRVGPQSTHQFETGCHARPAFFFV
jgi:hypothetical protein